MSPLELVVVFPASILAIIIIISIVIVNIITIEPISRGHGAMIY